MSIALSEKARELIPKAQIVSFASWESCYSPKMIAVFQQADREKRYLTDRDLEKIGENAPEINSWLDKARLLREKADKIVDLARKRVLLTYPGITAQGGELYPPARAEACWRDFWHFLRSISYGVAANSPEFTSSQGLEYMRLLYQELSVPLPAMICGLENLKQYSLQFFPVEEQDELACYFDHLINSLKNYLIQDK